MGEILRIGSSEFELDKKYPVVLSTETPMINALGRRFIRQMLVDLELPELPFNFNWKWIYEGKEGEARHLVRGKLPARIAQYIWKVANVKIPAETLQIMGNAAQAHFEVVNKLAVPAAFMDFTKTIDWDHGDFGDGGSCWWSGYRHARRHLTESGGGAVRWYDSRNNGISRAWFLNPMEGVIGLFNSPTSGFQVDVMSTVLMGMTKDTTTTDVDVVVDDEFRTSVFMNRREIRLIGSPDNIDKISTVIFTRKIPKYSSRGVPVVRCGHCEELVFETQLAPSPLMLNGFPTRICQSCLDNIDSFTCDNCNQMGFSEYSYTFDGHDGRFCESCHGNLEVKCYHCETSYHRDHHDMVRTADENLVCMSCLEAYYFTCEDCDKSYHIDEINKVEGDYGSKTVCNSCKDDNYTQCRRCDVYRPDDNFEDDDNPLCEKCLDATTKCAECGGQGAELDTHHGWCPDCIAKVNNPAMYDRTLLTEWRLA